MENTEFKITRKRKSNRAEIKEPVSVDLNKNVENIEEDKQEKANGVKISNEEESPKNDIPVYNTDSFTENYDTENSLNKTEQRNYWRAIFGNPFKSYKQAFNKDLPENNFDISKWEKKFNFGAFISPIFWIAWNWNFWVGILFYIIICIMEDYIFSSTSPIIAIIIFIVFGFLMGFNGNRVAYKTRPYRDLTHFEKSQKMWSWLLGIAPFILLYSFSFLGDSIFFNSLKQNDNYNNYTTSYNYTETETKQEAKSQKKSSPLKEEVQIEEDNALLYARNNGTEDLFKSLKTSAIKGDPESQRELAFIYADPKINDQKQAIMWFKKATEQGDKESEYPLGLSYLTGIDGAIEVDKDKAFEIFNKLSEQDFQIAKYSLGKMYENGETVEVDKDKAFELFQEAANAGEPHAQYYLGFIYRFAIYYFDGDSPNRYIGSLETAKYWYTKAAEQGNEEARQALAELENEGI